MPEENISLNTEGELTLKIYNPYQFDVPLKDLKFGVAYLDDYKITQQIIPISVHPIKDDNENLITKDTTGFIFSLPETKHKNPSYFRVVISENNLYFGLNGKPIELE